ncbi:hypothetical protein SAMN02745181_0452 [Rubritalea squalenifaciens DSM 18772]|uniref:Uncharacterized protein n=1 Tax=Rubritalea squalenifaciens DSM 18772 TaxID=1123071 RepID=A0A1M6CDE9_9BACT|nr:hypothetical protein [Rubritalea squalenifaciens]SHI59042.1 hypothetical protein SAMN02745181_0452 [Rubritalea squalenifaciens DSM 18772]
MNDTEQTKNLNEFRELQGLWRDPKMLDARIEENQKTLKVIRFYVLLILALMLGFMVWRLVNGRDGNDYYFGALMLLMIFIQCSSLRSEKRTLSLMKLMQHEVGVKKTALPKTEESQ